MTRSSTNSTNNIAGELVGFEQKLVTLCALEGQKDQVGGVAKTHRLEKEKGETERTLESKCIDESFRYRKRKVVINFRK